MSNDTDDGKNKKQDPATEAAKQFADELEKLGVRGVRDAKVIEKIAEKLTDVISRPDRDVGH